MQEHFTWPITREEGDIKEEVIEQNHGYCLLLIMFNVKQIGIECNTMVARKN